jgi:hypothetical protein
VRVTTAHSSILAIRQCPLGTGQLHAVQAQVAGPALEQGGAHRQPQRLHQPRQVAAEQLVLQCLGRRRQQHPLATQQRGHQVRKGLADTGPRFHHQGSAVLDGAGHGQRHLGLALTRQKFVGGTRQHAVGRERFPDRWLKTQRQASRRFFGVKGEFEPGDLVA